MTAAVWLAIVIVFLITIINAFVAFVLWVYCAGLTRVFKKHTDDDQKHWSSKWEESSDA